MGAIGLLSNYADATKRRLKSLLGDPVGLLDATASRGVENVQAALNKATGKPYNASNEDAYRKAMEDVAFQGMFIGPKAKTWNAAMNEKAAQMEAQGVDPRVIWKETGNWRAPDKMWRQEIPDNAATFNNDTHVGNFLDVSLNHKHLFDAYPEFRGGPTGLKLIQDKSSNSPGGSYQSGYITLNGNTDKDLSTIMHEIQHAIQYREGFAKGGNTEGMRGILSQDPAMQQAYSNDELVNAYRRLAGEAEARATQTRIPLTADERRFVYPADSYDVPLNKLIVRGLLGQ